MGGGVPQVEDPCLAKTKSGVQTPVLPKKSKKLNL
jgi:hypothetical protein